MTTITLQKDIHLSKTSFRDEQEMIAYFIEHTNYNYLDFQELNKQDISVDLENKIKKSKEKDISSFDNI